MRTLSSSSDTVRLHVDPVCGMTVSAGSPLHAEHANQTYFFCSEHCLHEFEAEPDAYVGAQHGPDRWTLDATVQNG